MAAASAVALCFAAGAAVFSQQKPAFRASVELLTIDVTVVDQQGNAVRSLTPQDFVVEIDGQRRPVVRSDFIDFSERPSSSALAAPPEVASNQASAHVADPRMILLLVDDESFTVTEGRSAFVKLADAVEHAFPGDALAFAALSGRSPIVEFTTDRRPVVDALHALLGRRFYAGTQTDIALVEAIDIARGNTFALDRAVERECAAMATNTVAGLTPGAGAGAGQSGVNADPCRRAVWADAIAVTTALHAQTQRTLAALARHLDRLGRLPGVKYVVLVSEGIVLDEEIGVAAELARVAAAASVTLQVLHLDRQDPGDVIRAHPAPRAPEDARLRAAGLDSVAAAAAGNVEHAITDPAAAFDRIGRQIATVYRLAVEMAPEDTRGGTRPIVVTTTRRGLSVHTHRQVVVPERIEGATMPGLERVLESPVIDRGIPMRMSLFGYRSPERGGNIVISAEATAPARGLRFAYSVRDRVGKSIMAAEVAPGAVMAVPGMPSLVVFRTTAPLGEYTVKLAAVDAFGRTGSVVQSVSLPHADARGFALGDLIVLPPGVDVLHSRPSAHIPRGTREAGVYFELYSTGPMPAEQATLVLEISDARTGASLGSTREQVSLTKIPGYAETAGRIRFSPAPLSPGEYVVRLSVDGADVHAVRQFRVR